MQPVIIKIEGDAQVPWRLVTLGRGHIPIRDEESLKRWKSFMSGNGMDTREWGWPPVWLDQCGPDLTAAGAPITQDVADYIARLIVSSGSNDLSAADLERIRALVVEGSVVGAKQAAREGTE